MTVFGYISLDTVVGAAVIIVTNKAVEIMGIRNSDPCKYFKLSILSKLFHGIRVSKRLLDDNQN